MVRQDRGPNVLVWRVQEHYVLLQRAAWPDHKIQCQQLRLDRKKAHKQQGRGSKKKRDKTVTGTWTEASGVGRIAVAIDPNLSFVNYSPVPDPALAGQVIADGAEEDIRQFMGAEGFARFQTQLAQRAQEEKAEGDGLARTEFFRKIEHLNPTLEFLISCGPLANLERAKELLPFVLSELRKAGRCPETGRTFDLGDMRVSGYSLTALDWASRRGNYAIAEWLATDERTCHLVHHGAPVAWACYTNKVELAKMLVSKGADSHATDDVVFGCKPSSHLAAENGQLLAMQWLVEECGHDIAERDTRGMNVRTAIRRNFDQWQSMPGSVAGDKYARDKGVREYA